jgi:hypothetical protein
MGSTSAGPEVALLLSTVALMKCGVLPEFVQLFAQSCTNPSQKRPVLGEHDPNCGTKCSNPLPSSEESCKPSVPQ